MEMLNSFEEYDSEESDIEIKKQVDEILYKYDFLIAVLYDVCWDSNCYFLLTDQNKNYYSVYGSHCSCYGYEGQFEPTPCLLEKVYENAKGELWQCDVKKFEEMIEEIKNRE